MWRREMNATGGRKGWVQCGGASVYSMVSNETIDIFTILVRNA
jgi:hypothetical protein